MSFTNKSLHDKILALANNNQFDEIKTYTKSQKSKLIVQTIYEHRQFLELLKEQAEKQKYICALATILDCIWGGSSPSADIIFYLWRDYLISDESLDWVLKNTNAYRNFTRAKSLVEYHADMAKREADRKAQEHYEKEMQRLSREKNAAIATQRLYNAIRRQDIKAVSALLTRGANVMALTPNGETILEFANSKRNADIIGLLKNKKLDQS